MELSRLNIQANPTSEARKDSHFTMEDKEKKAQEMYMEFQMLDQNIKQLQKQLEMVTSQLVELTVTMNSLDDFNAIKGTKQVFVPLSAGIYAEATISNNSKLLVNVGAKTLVQKDVASTKNLIEKQVGEMKELQQRMMKDLDTMTEQAGAIEAQLQEIMQQ